MIDSKFPQPRVTRHTGAGSLGLDAPRVHANLESII
jgi:hypothetical protein